jgi:hypothetical protein
MEERSNATAKEFLVAVTSELPCKGASLHPEIPESRKDFVVMK